MKAFITLCQKIWATKQWPHEWTRSLDVILPNKGYVRQCQSYQHDQLPEWLKVIGSNFYLAAVILAEEQAGRRTMEQIFNSQIKKAPSSWQRSVP